MERYVAKNKDGVVMEIVEVYSSHTKAGKYYAHLQSFVDRWFDKGYSVTKEKD